jgi:hypothetical protein
LYIVRPKATILLTMYTRGKRMPWLPGSFVHDVQK